MKAILVAGMSVIALFGLDLDAIVQKAKAQHKSVLIELVSPTCHYCKIMDTTLQDKDIQKALKRFYFVKVDVTKESLPPALEWRLTPSFIFIDQNGKPIKKVPGAWQKDDFLKILKEVQK